MALTSDTLRLAEARRIALRRRASATAADRRAWTAPLPRVVDRVGLVQIDSVNVLTRSHELPFLGSLLPVCAVDWLWGSGEIYRVLGPRGVADPGRAAPAPPVADAAGPRLGRGGDRGGRVGPGWSAR